MMDHELRTSAGHVCVDACRIGNSFQLSLFLQQRQTVFGEEEPMEPYHRQGRMQRNVQIEDQLRICKQLYMRSRIQSETRLELGF